jgi:hypothetical protein
MRRSRREQRPRVQAATIAANQTFKRIDRRRRTDTSRERRADTKSRSIGAIGKLGNPSGQLEPDLRAGNLPTEPNLACETVPRNPTVGARESTKASQRESQDRLHRLAPSSRGGRRRSGQCQEASGNRSTHRDRARSQPLDRAIPPGCPPEGTRYGQADGG